MHQLVNEILSLDDQIRFVGMINNKENTFSTKHNNNIVSLISAQEEEQFAIFLQKTKNLQDSFDDMLGKTKFMQINRQLIAQLVYFVDHFIIYVTFNPFIEEDDLLVLSRKIQATIKNTIAAPQLIAQSQV